jgi:lipopolysaccharide/colanic/teichoic acid biosynthesis glycosyltransferase
MSLPATHHGFPRLESALARNLPARVGAHIALAYLSLPLDGWQAEATPHSARPVSFGLQNLAKRALDIVAAAFGLVVTVPLMGLIALAIRKDSPGPVLHRTYRVGKTGQMFRFYKFRTMVHNAEELLDDVRVSHGQPQTLLKFPQDPRITRLGRFLRKYSLDELPQFWNILKGDMSLVGPRPPSLSEYQQVQRHHLRRMSVLPGLTGLWQIAARGDPSFETYVKLDCDYVDRWSLWLDFLILIKTVPAVLLGTGQ